MKWAFFMLCMAMTMPAMAQFNVKALKGAAKAVKAVTLTDAQMAEYVKEYIDWMDTHNQVCADDNEYTIRLKKLTSALKDGISSQGGTAAKLSDSQLGDLGEALVNSTYSQKQERSADDYGYEFLKSHGKNPWAMALSFQKLKKLQEEAGAQKSSKLNQLFSTHPDLDARIQRMEERATSEGIEKPAVTE